MSGYRISPDDHRRCARFDSRADRMVVSPDGEWVAVVLQRPARAGEVYGRTSYEVDPARSDIWLISLRTNERRNLTDGRNAAAGYWCPAWSPDGSRLALIDFDQELSESIVGDYSIHEISSLLERAREATRDGLMLPLIVELWFVMKLEVLLRRYVG